MTSIEYTVGIGKFGAAVLRSPTGCLLEIRPQNQSTIGKRLECSRVTFISASPDGGVVCEGADGKSTRVDQPFLKKYWETPIPLDELAKDADFNLCSLVHPQAWSGPKKYTDRKAKVRIGSTNTIEIKSVDIERNCDVVDGPVWAGCVSMVIRGKEVICNNPDGEPKEIVRRRDAATSGSLDVLKEYVADDSLRTSVSRARFQELYMREGLKFKDRNLTEKYLDFSYSAGSIAGSNAPPPSSNKVNGSH